MSHSVWLSSSLCLDEYPSNNGCEFTNELNYPLDFDAPNEWWSVTASEVIYEPDFWQNIRTSFNRVEIGISSFFYYHMRKNAFVFADKIFVRPKDNTLPTSPEASFSVNIIFVPISKTSIPALARYFDAVMTNGKDRHGKNIVWGDRNKDGYYIYHNSYSPLIVTPEIFVE